MNSKFYKCCAVPQCGSSTIKTPEKLFIHVPRKQNSRKMWLQLARRDSARVSSQSKMYFCEDHFDLPNDMENYSEYNLMGSVSQIRMKAGCLPTKFGCQPDRKRRTDMKTTRSLPAKRQRLEAIAECEKEIILKQVFEMSLSNAEEYKKDAANEIKTPPKTAAERGRMYRLRKKLAQESLSVNEVLYIPSTSQMTFEPSPKPVTDGEWAKEVKITRIKTEPEQDVDSWGAGPVHNSHTNISNENKIKLEPPSTSDDAPTSEVVCTEIFYPAQREYVMIKVERPLTPDHEKNLATPSTDPIFSSFAVKEEYDEDQESNDIGRNDLSIDNETPVKVEIEPESETEVIYKSDYLIRTKLKEKDKHYFNIKSILETSNATLIRSQEDFGYTCFFCTKYYQNPADLKDHATNAHTTINKKDIMKRYVADYVAKLDITSLNCKLCSSNIDSLEDLITHLNDAHNKNLFLDIKNQILPFKFDSNVHTCCICAKDFNKFRSLQSHVQTHYRNYECNECDLAFINRFKLMKHRRTHRVGNFQCQFCPKEFITDLWKKKHEKDVHDPSFKRNCGLCNETFEYMRQKEMHLIKVHCPTNKCNICDKVFLTRDTLSVHVKRDHLKIRNAQCMECGKSFYTSSELRVHMVKHTGTAQFECEVCRKSYKHKNYYNDHMRMHTNEYRHKCELCDMVFVQKTGLRTHLRARHGETYTPG